MTGLQALRLFAAGDTGLTGRQTVFATAVVAVLLAAVIELVRRRTMRIEYSWLWIVTGTSLFVLIFRYDWLLAVTNWIGAVDSSSTLFIFSIIFLVLLSIHFSIRISQLTNRVKNLIQETAILRMQVEELQKKDETPGAAARKEAGGDSGRDKGRDAA